MNAVADGNIDSGGSSSPGGGSSGSGSNGGAGTASLTTKPVTWQGGELAVNVDCGRSGFLSVSVLDGSTGTAIPGYAPADAHPYDGNSTNATVGWTSGATMEQLSGKRVAFAVKLTGPVKLYSFRGTFVF